MLIRLLLTFCLFVVSLCAQTTTRQTIQMIDQTGKLYTVQLAPTVFIDYTTTPPTITTRPATKHFVKIWKINVNVKEYIELEDPKGATIDMSTVHYYRNGLLMSIEQDYLLVGKRTIWGYTSSGRALYNDIIRVEYDANIIY